MKNKEDIICFIGFVIALICCTLTLIYDYKHPFTVDDLTVEERIRYEQMIFP